MHRIHRSCCRFPADREQARSHGLRPESQLSCGAQLRMPFWTLSGPAHRIHRSCCRFPADREQARSHGLRPESQLSCGALRRTPFWTLSGPAHRMHRSCCRFTADREQGPRPESQLSCGALRRMPFWTLCVLSSVPLNHPTLRVNSSVNALAMGDCSSLRCTSHTALVAPGSRTLR